MSRLESLKAAGSLGPIGPEGVPVPAAAALASTSSVAAGSAVDGVRCLGSEQLLFHIHTHLTVYVNGAPRRIPYGIGIRNAQASPTPLGPYMASGSCFYWLDTHAADGTST